MPLLVSTALADPDKQGLDMVSDQDLPKKHRFLNKDKEQLLSINFSLTGSISYDAEVYGGLRDKASISHTTQGTIPGIQYRVLKPRDEKVYTGYTLSYQRFLITDSDIRFSETQVSFRDGGTRDDFFGGYSFVTLNDKYSSTIDIGLSLYSISNSQSPALRLAPLAYATKITYSYFMSSNMSIDAFAKMDIMLMQSFKVNNLLYELFTGSSVMLGVGTTLKF